MYTGHTWHVTPTIVVTPRIEHPLHWLYLTCNTQWLHLTCNTQHSGYTWHVTPSGYTSHVTPVQWLHMACNTQYSPVSLQNVVCIATTRWSLNLLTILT